MASAARCSHSTLTHDWNVGCDGIPELLPKIVSNPGAQLLAIASYEVAGHAIVSGRNRGDLETGGEISSSSPM